MYGQDSPTHHDYSSRKPAVEQSASPLLLRAHARMADKNANSLNTLVENNNN